MYPPVSAGRKQNLRSRSGVSFERKVSRRIARGDGRGAGRKNIPAEEIAEEIVAVESGTRGVRFAGRRGAGGRCRRCRESMGAGSSARDALREEPPRHGLQDFPRVTRSLARGQKRDARRQREKRSGEPRHALAGAPRGSACAPHGASRLFRCVRDTTLEPPFPCARLCRLASPGDSRNRERTNSEEAGQELVLAAQSRCRSTKLERHTP